MMRLRTKIIQKLIHINEAIFFYPKLRKFYKSGVIGNAASILDVGANKGQSIDFFLGIVSNPEIEAFEPNRKLFTKLTEKYRKNPKIGLHNVGISNIKGTLEFHENILDETSTFEEFNPDSAYLKKKAKILGVEKDGLIVDNYQVDVIRLRDFLEERPGTFFDVLKIDAEGHELQCLQGLFGNGSGHCPIRLIQFESHHDDMYLKAGSQTEIESLLTANGFKKIADIRHGFGDFSELIYENVRL